MVASVRRAPWIPFALAAAGVVLAAIAVRLTADSPPEPARAEVAPQLAAAPFPPGFDYPQSAAQVQAWVQGRDGHRMRRHGWFLFAGVNQTAPDRRFVWRTWPTSTQLFPWQYGRRDSGPTGASGGAEPVTLIAKNVANAASADAGQDPMSLPGAPNYGLPDYVQATYPACVQTASDGSKSLRDGPTFQSNGDVMIAGVVFNEPAFWHAWNNTYFDARILDGLAPADATARPGAVRPLPAGSMVLKPMLWPVQGSGYTALPVWDDPTSYDSKTYAGFEIQALWKRAVAVTTQASYPPAQDVTYLVKDVFDPNDPKKPFGPVTYRQAPVVPVSRFYQLAFTGAELQAMHACDHALLDASAFWSYGRRFDASDKLVLIAMHVMTKEQPGWTFQSAWWHDKAVSCKPDAACQWRYGGWRPASVPTGDTRWQNYMLVTTYGQPQSSQKAADHANRWPLGATAGQKWPVAFNPYIELAARHPIVTNCINCHHRAAWPTGRTGFTDRKFPGRQSSYLARPSPDAQDVFQDNGCLPGQTKSCVLDGLATLDSMWSVADRANYLPLPPEGEKK